MDQKQATILALTDNAAEKVKTLMEQEGEETSACGSAFGPAAVPASSTRSTSTTRSPMMTRSSRKRESKSSSTR